MKASKEKTPFFEWLEESALNGLLYEEGIYLWNISKIETELFVFNNEEGNPLCIFEVGKDYDIPYEYENFLLKKMPRWSLKLPGYAVLYRRLKGQGERPIVNFRVKKFTPFERSVGNFSPRQLAGFLAATVTFLRKQYEKENDQCNS